MSDVNRLYEHHTLMAMSIYNFLDNLLTTVEPGTTPVVNTDEATELSENQRLECGGYSEDMFIFLSEREKDEYSCNVCYCILKDAHQCKNSHKFCYSCVYKWSVTESTGSEVCPVCRCDGLYARNEKLNDRIGRKRVKCQNVSCNWRGFLRDYEGHSHKIYDFKELNSHLDLPSTRIIITKQNKLEDKPIIIPESITSTQTTSDVIRKFSTPSSESPNKDLINPQLESVDIGPSSTTSILTRRSALPPRQLTRGTTSRVSSNSNSSIQRKYSQESTSHRRDPIAPNCRDLASNNRPGLIPRPPNQPRRATLDSLRSSVTIPNARRDSATDLSASSCLNERIPRVEENQPVSSRNTIQPATNTVLGNINSTGLSSITRSPQEAPIVSTVLPSVPPRKEYDSSGQQPLVYRRLAPIQQSRVRVASRLREGREQLAMMLSLMSIELEERRRVIERQAQANLERERNRLQSITEVRQLNRRLSSVANNLERILTGSSNSAETGSNNRLYDDSSTDDD